MFLRSGTTSPDPWTRQPQPGALVLMQAAWRSCTRAGRRLAGTQASPHQAGVTPLRLLVPSQITDQARRSLFYYSTLPFPQLIFCSLFPSSKCSKEEKKKRKRTVWLPWPITQRYESRFPFSRLGLSSTPAPPKGKQRAPSRSHLSCHRAAPAGTAVRFPPHTTRTAAAVPPPRLPAAAVTCSCGG